MIAYFKNISSNETLLLYLGLFSLLFFVVTLIVIPWLILKIPQDYFSAPKRHSFLSELKHPVIKILILILKNLLGSCFLVLGLALLVLPGQGLLTILLGIIMIDFPGKFHMERWLVQRKAVFRSINWLRKKGNKEPIQI